MTFKVIGLNKDKYESYFQLSSEELAERGVIRSQVVEPNSIPCRVSLVDAQPGETVLLLNHAHLDEQSPFDSKYAIYIREKALEANLPVNETPSHLNSRLLSVRGFSKKHHLQSADVVEGSVLKPAIKRFFEEADIEYLHIHNAREGCYHAKVVRS